MNLKESLNEIRTDGITPAKALLFLTGSATLTAGGAVVYTGDQLRNSPEAATVEAADMAQTAIGEADRLLSVAKPGTRLEKLPDGTIIAVTNLRTDPDPKAARNLIGSLEPDMDVLPIDYKALDIIQSVLPNLDHREIGEKYRGQDTSQLFKAQRYALEVLQGKIQDDTTSARAKFAALQAMNLGARVALTLSSTVLTASVLVLASRKYIIGKSPNLSIY